MCCPNRQRTFQEQCHSMEICAAFVVVVLAYDLVAVFTILGLVLVEEFHFPIFVHTDPSTAATITHPCPHVITQNVTGMVQFLQIDNKDTVFADTCWLRCTNTTTVQVGIQDYTYSLRSCWPPLLKAIDWDILSPIVIFYFLHSCRFATPAVQETIHTGTYRYCTQVCFIWRVHFTTVYL